MNCPACTCPMANPNPSHPDYWQCPHPDCELAGTEADLAARRRGITRAEIHEVMAEDQGRGFATSIQVKKGNPLRRPALRAERLAELATVICPWCHCSGHLVETVPPTETHSGHYGCRAPTCTWSGPGSALHPEPIESSQAQAVDRWGTACDKDVSQALADERKRGKKGGGSSNATGKAKKQGAKASRYRADRDENCWVKLRVVNPLTNVVRLPGVDRPADDFKQAVARFLEDQQRKAGGQ